MLLIPAIDIKDGKCVRLRQGLMDDSTVYGDSPVDMADKWVELGARRLHLVDSVSYTHLTLPTTPYV